jgi:hypothetical protein
MVRHPRGYIGEPPLVALCERFRLLCRADEGAEHADHGQDAGNVSLIEGKHSNAGADEIGSDLRLEIGKGEDEVRLERENLRMSADVNADTRGFSRRTCGGGTA